MIQRFNSIAAAAFGLCFLSAVFPIGGFGEDEVKSGDGATLEQLAKIPASGFAKMIENSVSPDKRLGVALGSKDAEAEYMNVFVTAKVEQSEDGKLSLGDSKVVGRE